MPSEPGRRPRVGSCWAVDPVLSECHDGAMRVMRALEVRARFGEVIDQAAAGERIVIERAGHRIAAIVPLSDLDAIDPDKIRERRKEALERLIRLRDRTIHLGVRIDGTAFVRADRDSGHRL